MAKKTTEEQRRACADRIRAVRLGKGLTVPQLTELTGNAVSVSAVYTIEAGKAFPSDASLLALAKALGVSAGFLATGLTGGGKPGPKPKQNGASEPVSSPRTPVLRVPLALPVPTAANGVTNSDLAATLGALRRMRANCVARIDLMRDELTEIDAVINLINPPPVGQEIPT